MQKVIIDFNPDKPKKNFKVLLPINSTFNVPDAKFFRRPTHHTMKRKNVLPIH
jgi:hypothetical protein